MLSLFSTAGVHPRNSFKLWREILFDRFVPIEQQRLDDGPFDAHLDVAEIGPLVMTRIGHGGAMRSEATPGTIRRHSKDGTVVVTFQLAGTLQSQQDGRSCVQRAGDLAVVDHRPTVHLSSRDCRVMYLELPRERLESMLGSARLYTCLTVGAELGSTALATSFFHELIRVRRQLAPDALARMATIGTDLIVAGIAARLEQEVPQSLHGSVVVQRAKAHIEAHLSDQTLDPPQLAAAMGVSLRRLQELFHERGQHIADYIWHRRLEAAAKRLIDPGCAHLSVGMLAYGCGFASQAHFSRRFKDRFGMVPREYRQAAGMLGEP